MKTFLFIIALLASSAAFADCVGPYHVLAPDGRCVWSCSVGTTPDNRTGECACKPGLVQTSLDRFNRRVCEQPPQQCSGHMVFQGRLNSVNRCIGALNVTVDVNPNGQFNGDMRVNPDAGSNCDVLAGTVSGRINANNQVAFTGNIPFNNAQVAINFTGQTNQPRCTQVQGQFTVPAWNDRGNYNLNR